MLREGEKQCIVRFVKYEKEEHGKVVRKHY